MELEIKNENVSQEEAEYDDFQSYKYKIEDVEVDFYDKMSLIFDVKDAQNKIIQKLQNARKEMNMTQLELSKLSTLPQQTISRIESNPGSPSLENILAYTYYVGYELKLVKKGLVNDEIKRTWETMVQDNLIEKAINEERERIAREMLKIAMSDEMIAKITKLDKDTILAFRYIRQKEMIEKNINTAKDMIKDGIAIELISKYTKIDIEIIQDIQKQVENETLNHNDEYVAE